MELFPIQLLILLVLMNRYLLGPFIRRVRGGEFDRTRDDYEPTVAIIIPLYNEGEGIFHTVRSLLGQDYPREKLSIVVVDDCSQDDSYAWACKAAEGRANVSVMRNPHNMGKRKGINRAVRASSAEIIVSVDSDVVADRRAVRELVRRFTSEDVAAVGGRTFVVNRHASWLTRMVEIKFHYSQDWLKDLERSFDRVMCLTGCLTAYRRHVLLELEPILENRNVAGVSIKYGEDRFLTRQIVKAGYRTRYTSAAFCQTAAPRDLPSYYSQQLRWRRSNLIDMFCGMSHAWRLPAPVAIHYTAQFVLLLAYPVVILENLSNGDFMEVLLKHLGLIAVMGVIYRYETRHLPAELRVPAHAFLPIAFLMPVTYALFTPLALLTLDSGSWETRGSTAPARAAPAGRTSPPPPAAGTTTAGM
ncbi:MAG: glycosyltransferase family 2 protein [Myxococcaceae bacterium]|nr:glycosyltransferase family 2 protein [Myxococcaceae bacterium]MCI0669036.1 glycosyltransferase family 2 protein [Myxococcaceae bacterium]